MALEPKNAAAEQVASYFAKYHDNPELRQCPWNLAAPGGELYLPELPTFSRHVPHWWYAALDDESRPRQSRNIDTMRRHDPFEKRAV